MGLFDIFKRKKAPIKPVDYDARFYHTTLNIFNDFGNNINLSDTVKICIDRIATHAAKLKPRYVKKDEDATIVEKEGTLSFLLKHKPNPLMTPYDFLYRVVTLLFLNNNVFIYPLYDENSELTALLPLKPNSVEALQDSSGEYFLRFNFSEKEGYTVPYSSIIHLRRFYGVNDIFGGTGALSDHSALLKTIKINDSLLQGLDNAVRSSFQIKGLLKINGMLSEKDKKAQKEEFDRVLKASLDGANSSIMPIDAKADYVPLNVEPKLVESEVLTFLQQKIITYFGVSEPIFNNKYNEDEFNAFYEGTIEGIAIALSEAFSKVLLSERALQSGEEIFFYSERLQYASWNTKVSAIEKLMGLGILSLNESRALLGLEPIEGGDKRLQSLNFVDANHANKYQVGALTPQEELDEKT